MKDALNPFVSLCGTRWESMLDDLYIGRAHLLGSLYKAKQKKMVRQRDLSLSFCTIIKTLKPFSTLQID